MVYKDYYRILELDEFASADQIKKAYRKLAMQYHPDRNHGKEDWANEKFKDINEAFSVLGDPEKRSQYDQFGTVGTFDDILDSQAVRTTFEDFKEVSIDFGSFDDIFGDVTHNTGFSYHKFRRGFDSSRSMRDHVPGNFTLEDIPDNNTSSKYYVEYVFSLTSEQAAKGLEKKLKRNGKELKVTIPANIKSGSKIKLKDALNLTDGRPGDIMIHIKVE